MAHRLLLGALVVLLTLMPAAGWAAESPVGPSDRLHIQFTGVLRVPAWATTVEIDGEDSTRAEVRQLNRRGLTTICYISAGSWERYRKDAKRFPASVLGGRLADWPAERWLDIRARKQLRPIMRARINNCARKGFAGIEFDNVDGYNNRTGFALHRGAQLRYNRMLARLAHERGLSPGLKNAVGLLKPLSRNFDWALNEECVRYRECGRYRHFRNRGKAVFILEYRKREQQRLCEVSQRLGAFGQRKRLSLSAWARPC